MMFLVERGLTQFTLFMAEHQDRKDNMRGYNGMVYSRNKNITSGGFMSFKHAIVRKPSENFADGLTTMQGEPDFRIALTQHQAYCQALIRCGLDLTALEADSRFPDSTFVEDTAVLTERCAVLTNPGAPSRQGEEQAMLPHLEQFFERIHRIQSPGTLDGGDICEADGHFFIGISQRTNREGGRQLAEILAGEGYTSSFIDVRAVPGILHLKSGIAYLGEGNLLLIPALQDLDLFSAYRTHTVPDEESYAANCVRVNDSILLPAGYPQVYNLVDKMGCECIPLEMSEFARMDGGLSCLSLRF